MMVFTLARWPIVPLFCNSQSSTKVASLPGVCYLTVAIVPFTAMIFTLLCVVIEINVLAADHLAADQKQSNYKQAIHGVLL